MRLISRYLLRQFLLTSAAFFFGLILTWLAADSVLHLDDFEKDITGGLDPLLRVLEVIPFALPLSCLVGAVVSLSRAVRFREITAIRCGGIPLQRALIPILVVALALGGLLALFEDRVTVPIRRFALNVTQEFHAGQIGSLERFNDRFWYSNGSSVFIASKYNPQTQTLSDVTVLDFDHARRIERRIDASAAELVDGTLWDFKDATVRGFGTGNELTRETSTHLRLDLGVSGKRLSGVEQPAETITLRRLNRAARRHAADLELAAALGAVLHSRIAQPLSILILVLFAIPFAIRDAERGDSLPRALLASLGAAALFFAAFTGAVLVARSGYLPPAFPVWGTVLAALGIGGWRFRAISE